MRVAERGVTVSASRKDSPNSRTSHKQGRQHSYNYGLKDSGPSIRLSLGAHDSSLSSRGGLR